MHLRRHARELITIATLGMLALGGCGATATSSTPGASDTHVPASTMTVTIATNGCPTQHIPVDVTRPPDLVLTQADSGKDAVTIATGKLVEIQLKATMRWLLDEKSVEQNVSINQPAGYFNKQLDSCIWHVSTVATGTTHLDFTGLPICAPNVACPAIAAIAHFELDVR